MSPLDVLATMGKYDLSVANEFGSENAVVTDIELHPDWNFNAQRYDADISIVILQRRVKFSQQIQPICIPEESYEEVGGIGTVVGWGRSESSEKHDTIPNELVIPAVNSSHCYTTFTLLSAVSSNRAFCGGYENEGRSPCLGDSGSGFYVLDPVSASWNVRGIVSASLVDLDYGCDVNKFSLYTNVARFTSWINKTIKETQEISYQFIDYKCVLYENR
jgi:secreted trypsin-like serine protease